MKKHKHLSEEDIQFMSSLSQAALERPTRASQFIVWILLVLVVWLIFWASVAELDKIVRADGKVVPSSQIQVIQNLEGGIVEDIFVKSGEIVRKGQTLLKLDNTQFISSFGENKIRLAQLDAKSTRLQAESTQTKYVLPTQFENNEVEQIYLREFELYQSRQKQLQSSDQIIFEQIEQKKSELNAAYSKISQLKRSVNLIRKEVNVMRPLVKQGIASEVDLLKLQREENEILSRRSEIENSIPQLKSIINEYRTKRVEAQEEFYNQAKQELNEVLSERAQIEKSKIALEDRVLRTDVKSPVDGTIKQFFVNTIGGVVQPGSDIVEIVPLDDALVLETKIAPADIGFLYPGLKAKIKFTAYDFAIYGGLDGSLESLSADTITDEEGNSFYLAKIKTDKNFLGSETKPLALMPGMTANVDIIVGKHTILDYLLKPIIKAKDLALRES